MRHAFWRSTKLEYLPGMPGSSGGAARAEQARGGVGAAGLAGTPFESPGKLALRAQELLLPGFAQGLSDFDVRATAGHGGLARNRTRGGAQKDRNHAAASGGRRGQGHARRVS